MTDHPIPHPDVGGWVLGSLEPDDARAFDAHLKACEGCRREVETLATVRASLDLAAPPFEVPAGLRERTLAAVARAGAAPATRRLARVIPALAAAAIAIAAAGIVLRGSERGVVFELVSEAGAARGRAVVTEGGAGRIVDLEVEGLPPPPPGGVFECWFVGPGDTLDAPNRVSAGTFRTGRDGRAKVRMTAAADPQRFQRMGVTLELDGGDPRRTGEKVLVSSG